MTKRAAVKLTIKPTDLEILMKQLIEVSNMNTEAMLQSQNYNTESLEVMHNRISNLERTLVATIGAITSLTTAMETLTHEERGEGN